MPDPRTRSKATKQKKQSPTGYLSPKAAGGIVRHSSNHGVFAVEPISRGELIAVWGGEVVPREVLRAYSPDCWRLSLQVDDDAYIVSSNEGPADWVNHSCAPNAGLRGQITLVAMRNIQRGEEITFDYAMTDGSDYDEFECACGAKQCRRHVSGNDWQLPELWLAYGGHFSPYLLRRIEQLKRQRRAAAKREQAVVRSLDEPRRLGTKRRRTGARRLNSSALSG